MTPPRRRGIVGDMVRGAGYAFRGIAVVLFRPSLWPFVVGPVLVTLVLFVGLAAGAWHLVGVGFDAWLRPTEPAQYSVLWTLAELWLRLWAIAVAALFMYFASNVVATPFNDWLSQKVETLRLGPYAEPFSWATLFGDLAQSVWHSVLTLMVWMALLLFTLTLNIVPVFGALASLVVSAVATALLIARESMDGCQSRRRMSFGHKLRFVRHQWPILLGFGLVGSLVVWIPGVNLLVVPLSVAGGTMLYCDLERDGRVIDASGNPGFRLDRRRDAGRADPTLTPSS